MIVLLKVEAVKGKWWTDHAGKELECDLFDTKMGYRVKGTPESDVSFFIPISAVQTVIEDGTEILKVGLEVLVEECIPERHGDWIDLKASEDISIEKDTSILIPLGIKIAIPKGYEAHLLPRSSTFSKFGIIQTNSMGIIDENYGEEWKMPVFATQDTSITKGTRIAQFRLIKKMGMVQMFNTTMDKEGKTRSGFGSTDLKKI